MLKGALSSVVTTIICNSVIILNVIWIMLTEATGDVTFISEPQDIIVEPSGSVTFDCVYMSQADAIWAINDLEYVTYVSALPQKHSIFSNKSGSFLSVHDVDLTMNGSTYQCIVNSCYSTVGHLIIVRDKEVSSSISLHNLMKPSVTVTTFSPFSSTCSKCNWAAVTSNIKKTISSGSNVTVPTKLNKEISVSLLLSCSLVAMCTCMAFSIGIAVYKLAGKRKWEEREIKEMVDNKAYEFANAANIAVIPNTAYASVKRT